MQAQVPRAGPDATEAEQAQSEAKQQYQRRKQQRIYQMKIASWQAAIGSAGDPICNRRKSDNSAKQTTSPKADFVAGLVERSVRTVTASAAQQFATAVRIS